MDVKIIVATHKPYWMPEDKIYLPVQVGAAGAANDLGYARDNTGDNISNKNKNYCELTGLYWAWKNLSADYIGLAHYRRHFTLRKGSDKTNLPITGEELIPLLENYDVLLPRKRNYFIDTTYDQYVHAHHKEDLDTTEAILKERYPEYLDAYNKAMKSTSGHRFNMFVMKKYVFDKYCTWLFDVLFELENRLDISEYSNYDARVYGFVGERLLDVWMMTNMVNSKDIPYVFMEKQNWFVKGGNFIKRKIKGEKR